jgi:helix-turn-helix protein
MSDGEHKVADGTGKFAQVVVDGRKVPDIEWHSGRLILSNKRLVLVSNEGKRTIPLGSLQTIRGRQDANRSLAEVSNYLSLQTGSDVTLVSPADQEAFELALYSAILDQEVVLAKHPAVEGGVVQDTAWEKARVKIEAGEVDLAITTGTFVEIHIDDVGTVDERERTVSGETRPVLEVEHTEATTAVQTHVAGVARHMNVLASLLRKGEANNTAEVDLSPEESEVLMALYSGVSPFEIPEFVGMEVDTVEEIFDRLIEAGVLEETRIRRQVELKARGRNIASDAMSDQ